MPQLRKKPVVISAIQWDGANVDEVLALTLTKGSVRRHGQHGLAIDTLEGTMTADRYDWIICGVKGELYPCKPDIFAATYEAVI